MKVSNARQIHGVTPAVSVELNWSRCVLPPFEHQKVGVRALITHPRFALFDEMGAGKTKQVIDTACFLADAGVIDTVLVISPASVRAVWAGEFGEIDKHAWFPSTISEYHSKTPRLAHAAGTLNWHVTNYEFIRDKARLTALMTQLVNRKVMMVLDESSRIKSHKAATTKAVLKLSEFFPNSRKVILNGTPISNNPLDLWAQLEFLDPAIIGANGFFHYRAKYAVMGGWNQKQVIGWQNLAEVQDRIKPFCLRRLKVDCLDLPEKTYTVRAAAFDEPTWKIYKQMRDECIAYLGDQPNQEVSVAPQAVVRLLRLSQLTTGFIGGIQEQPTAELIALSEMGVMPVNLTAPREVSREKLDALLEMIEELLEADSSLRLLVWCRFRTELHRAAQEVFDRFKVHVGRIEGEQSEKERRATVTAFQDLTEKRPMVLFGNPQAGGLGLTLHAAHRVVYMSNDYNLISRLQSEDRVHRPGQRHPVLYTDVIATGPEGQRTIDHIILNALRKKQDLASWTTDVWRRELAE
jgi:SNF2 family DNA or RNA helicase